MFLVGRQGSSRYLSIWMCCAHIYISDPITLQLSNLLDSILQSPNVCASNAIRKLFAILEQYKGWHSSHAQIARNLLLLVDIHLEKAHICIGFAKFADFGSNSFARAAPCGEEIDDNGTGGGQFFECLLAICAIKKC